MSQQSTVKINGNSMFPLICDQDELTVDFFDQPKKLDQCSEGDILFLKDKNEWLVHRLLRTGNQSFTKGDWSLHPDQVDLAWGKVVAVKGNDALELKDLYLAQMSKTLLSHRRSIRQWTRFKMILYVFFKKWRL